MSFQGAVGSSTSAESSPDYHQLGLESHPLLARQPSAQSSDQDPRPNSPTELNQFELFAYRYPLVLFLLAWIAGIGLASSGFPGAFVCAGATLAAIATALWVAWRPGRTTRLVRCCAAVIAVMAASVCYNFWFQPVSQDSLAPLASRQAQPVALRGVIVEAAVWSPNPYHRPSAPDSDPWLTRWRVQWDSLREVRAWKSITCQSKLSTKGYISHLLPGDRIEVYGSFEAISEPTNPGMPNFAQRAQSDGLFVTVRTDDASQIRLIESTYRKPLQRLRGLAIRYLDATLKSHVSFDQAPLAAALIFGQREQVDWQSQQQLMASGTLHMLAISGLHVEMIAAALLLFCQIFSLGRGTMAVLVITICAAYAGLAGANPPVLRALILIVAFSVARYFGLSTRLFNLLALAALLLLWSDVNNFFNVGVQLSFLAVATIGIFNRDTLRPRRSALQSLLEENLPTWRRWGLVLVRQFISGIKISFWVWLFTTPLIWHHFHVVSLVSIPLNVLLTIPLMIGLLAGLITPLVNILPGVGFVTGSIAGMCLATIQWLVDLSCAVPLGHIWLPSPPLWWSVSFYTFALTWIIVFRTTRTWILAGILLGWVVLAVCLFAFGPRGILGSNSLRPVTSESELRCTFIDVGHGTSAIIELPDGRIWLYDAGHMGIAERSHEAIAASLWSIPTTRIDTLLISHADADHYNGISGLIQRFQIGRIVSTQRFWESTSREVQLVHQAIISSKKQREVWNSQTDTVTIDASTDDEVQAVVLHPPSAFRAETDNADSLCLQIEYAGVRLLLPGDIEGSGLQTLCESPPRRCQIMMAPHHGSLSHDVSELLQWCDPQVVIISGNERAVRPEVLRRFASAKQLGITYADGAIQVRVHGDGTIEALRWNLDQWSALED